MAPVLVQVSSEPSSVSGSPDSKFAVHPSEVDKFHQLVADVNCILGPSSGLDSESVDVKHLEQLMHDYVSQEEDWKKYAFADMSRGYTRNLVDEGNGKSNLVRFSLNHGSSEHY